MSARYREFFKESPDGQEFVRGLIKLIDQQHEQAEARPDQARDYTQRAKGIREVIDKINSLCAGAKKVK